jgi:hypothetical protein
VPIENVGALDRPRANTVRTPAHRSAASTLGVRPHDLAQPSPPGRPRPPQHNTKTAPIALQPVSCPARQGQTRPADRAACPAGVLCTLGQSVRWSSVRLRSGPDRAARVASPRGGRVFKGCSCKRGGPENALQPRHPRPLQEFLRNNARLALQLTSLPPPRGRHSPHGRAKAPRAPRSCFAVGIHLPPPPLRVAQRKREIPDPRSQRAGRLHQVRGIPGRYLQDQEGG